MIIHDDCLDYCKRNFAYKHFDFIFADPPYNSGIEYKHDKLFDIVDKEDPKKYWSWLCHIAAELIRIGKTVIIKHSSAKINEWVKYMPESRLLIWYKPFSSGFPKDGLMFHYEPLWLLCGQTKHVIKDVLVQSSGNSNPDKTWDHPAQMPALLITELMLAYTNEGDLVLDPFGGSGTTATVANQLKRKWITIEKSKDYCNIIEKRIKEEGNPETFMLWQLGGSNANSRRKT